MRKRLVIIIAAVLTAGLLMPGPVYSKSAEVKNVILMIGSGMGYNHILAADYYLTGASDTAVYESFPVKLAMSTYSAGLSTDASDDNLGKYHPGLWSEFTLFMRYATDSAAAATAMSTGTKTYDAAVGVDQDVNALRHMAEYFEAVGRSTGVVTTVPVSHATPAGFFAHNENRSNYHEIIAEMVTKSAADVIMGAGNPDYDDNGAPVSTPSYEYIPERIWKGLKNGTLNVSNADSDSEIENWTLIETKEEFEALMEGETPERIIGVAQVHATLQERRGNYSSWSAGAFEIPFNENVPDLSVMTLGALNVLDNNEKGFFLVVDGGAINWCGHFGQSGRLIEEMYDFNKAVEAVCQWVEENSSWDETLLIVTSNHETGYLSGRRNSYADVISKGRGVMPEMYWHENTVEGYVYSGMLWHTNLLVPFFARGAGSEMFREAADEKDPVRGYYLDNTEISRIIIELITKE